MKVKRHGLHAYSNLGCRCDECRTAWRNWCRDARQRRFEAITADDPRHGKSWFYTNHGCRCEPCREASRANRAARAAVKREIDRSAIGSEVVASPPRVAASDRVAEPRAKSAIEQDAPPP